MAVELFQRGLPDLPTAEERLAAVVQDANRRIHERSRREEERQGMGTTLTAALLDETSVAIAHVGDSRAYLFRDGELSRLTQDHSLVAELVRRGKLTESQAEEHPQRSIITRALGIEPYVDVDTWSYPVRAGDVLLLCSDGLTSMVAEERIAAILAGSADLDRAASALIKEANDAGGRDNISVILTRVEDPAAQAGSVVEHPTIVTTAAPAHAPDEDGGAMPADAPGEHGAATPDGADPGTDAPESADVPAAQPAKRAAGEETMIIETAEAPRAKRGRRVLRLRGLAALVTVLIVLGLILGGGYLATRQLYFIGTNPQGIVTIYRGLPYTLPAGIHLYETWYVSGVPAALIPADRRSRLLNHSLRSQADAQNLVRQLELGKISG